MTITSRCKFLLGLCFIACAGCTFANAANPVRRVKVDKELILTHKEKVAFDKFKASIYKNVTTLNLKFVKHDLYLLRWIRAKNLDVARAQREFFEFLEFIRENNLDKIQQEDFSDILEDHPYNDTITDLRGRPLGYGSIGSSWNIRRTIVQGRRSRLIRLAYRMYIGLMEKVVELNGKQQNITRFSVLMNFDGFNLVQHACPNCVSTYIVLLQLYERYLPECAEEIIIINAPSTWYTLLGMLRPFFSPDLNRALKIFGPNTNVWKPYLDSRIDPDKLPEEYGGNRGESQER